MKKLQRNAIILAASALMGVGAANAVPAFPGLTTVTQPDGTTVEVRAVGDEWSNYLLTEDGYLLTWADGVLCYADADAEGRPVSSGIKATSLSKRGGDAKAFLSRIDMKGRVLPALERRAGKQRSVAGAGRRGTPKKANVGLSPNANFPVTGKQKALVVLVEYPDQKFTLADPHDYFTRMLTEDNFSDYKGRGSAAQWFRENSNGQFQPEFDLYGPVTLSQPMAYYGGADTEKDRSDIRPQKMAVEVCEKLDAEVDFSQYDRDGDGFIDNVFIFYAGEGENYSHNPDHIWPHAWHLTYAEPDAVYRFDGVQLDYYACTNEWINSAGMNRPDGIGTFCHEFSHVMGLPDLYTTKSVAGAFTPRAWDVMDSGSYNNESTCPPHYSAYERYALGWLEPKELTEAADIRLNTIDTNTACIINTGTMGEFYLLENRQKQGWDTYIPGHGMLAWHIHYDMNVWYSNSCNNNPSHQYIDIVEADNILSNDTRAGDAFPGTANVTSFTDDTTPSMLAWNGKRLETPVTDIAESEDGVITFKVKGGAEKVAKPEFTLFEPRPDGIELGWTRQVLAESYVVCVSDANGYVDGFDHRNVGCEQAFTVTGLTPSTSYKVSVAAVSDYYEGKPVESSFTTPAPSFKYERPEVGEAADVAETSATARWSAHSGAADYLLSVYTKAEGEPATELLDFAEGPVNLPEGWSTTAARSYSVPAYAGAAVPSLRFIGDGQRVRSPRFTADVSSISFWARGVSARGEVTLKVLGWIDGEWVELASYVPVEDQGGEIFTLDDVQPGVRAVTILTSTAKASASVAFDDLTVKWGNPWEPVYVADLNGKTVGNTTSVKVEGLKPSTTYFYTVSAVNAASEKTLPSAESTFTTLEKVGIETVGTAPAALVVTANGLTLDIAGAAGPVTVSDVTGRAVNAGTGRLTVGAPGIYVVTDGVSVVKVAVK